MFLPSLLDEPFPASFPADSESFFSTPLSKKMAPRPRGPQPCSRFALQASAAEYVNTFYGRSRERAWGGLGGGGFCGGRGLVFAEADGADVERLLVALALFHQFQANGEGFVVRDDALLWGNLGGTG